MSSNNKNIMHKSLKDEIDEARMQVHTDSYPMSIGEMINLYQDEELDIHPEFQRVYRWSTEQKSKLIESILLGIPLPSIFVSQRDDGVWDVVDGLQRLSTIFSFLGILRNDDNEIIKPLELKATKYLPSLEGKVWEDKHNTERQIDTEIKRIFKREKLDIKIIKRESETDTKFELFQRLNTGGSKLSDQEVRNCILLMLNSDAFAWLQELSKFPAFVSSLPISNKQRVECYAQELALKYFIQRHYSEELRKEHTDVGPYLTAELSRLFNPVETIMDLDKEKIIFEKTFTAMNEALDESSFKKYNHDKGRHEGAVSIPVFEALTKGVSAYIEKNHQILPSDLGIIIQKASQQLTIHQKYRDTLEGSVRPIDRMVIMGQIGVELIS